LDAANVRCNGFSENVLTVRKCSTADLSVPVRIQSTYEGTACEDIRNCHQMFSSGAGSGDKQKKFSIPIAQQHGANHDAGDDAACPKHLRNKLRNRVIFIA